MKNVTFPVITRLLFCKDNPLDQMVKDIQCYCGVNVGDVISNVLETKVLSQIAKG